MEARAKATFNNETEIQNLIERREMCSTRPCLKTSDDEYKLKEALEKRCVDIENTVSSKVDEIEVTKMLAEGCGNAFKAFGEFLEVRFCKIETDLTSLAGKLKSQFGA